MLHPEAYKRLEDADTFKGQDDVSTFTKCTITPCPRGSDQSPDAFFEELLLVFVDVIRHSKIS